MFELATQENILHQRDVDAEPGIDAIEPGGVTAGLTALGETEEQVSGVEGAQGDQGGGSQRRRSHESTAP